MSRMVIGLPSLPIFPTLSYPGSVRVNLLRWGEGGREEGKERKGRMVGMRVRGGEGGRRGRKRRREKGEERREGGR